MAILVKATVPGMDAGKYNSVITELRDNLKATPGFLGHAAYPENDGSGFVVVEIWESRAQLQAWVESNVMPHFSSDQAPRLEFQELSNVIMP